MAIVLSYHGNRESEVALQEALRIAGEHATSLVVVLARRTGQEDPRTVEDAEDRLWAHLGRADVPFEIRHTEPEQDVADAVLDAAQAVDASAVVLGLRPGGSGHTTVGPNASRILLDAPCPVITTTYHPQP
ncbi:universal stress protein [Actinomyces polynesiensis]|uniref:universal stress protein n=1 Tax=Actinomyces polynesiensis TaxID=1325934 RepID=UPI0005BCBF3B|nr:universal stress protein [Actinomyces polynesiensis]